MLEKGTVGSKVFSSDMFCICSIYHINDKPSHVVIMFKKSAFYKLDRKFSVFEEINFVDI